MDSGPRTVPEGTDVSLGRDGIPSPPLSPRSLVLVFVFRAISENIPSSVPMGRKTDPESAWFGEALRRRGMSNEKTREELRSDLETYQKQLLEVERLRSSEGKEEGEEEELRELEIELREFVRITLDLLRDAGAEPGAVVEWKEGEKCMAKYHEDGEWYPAVVVELHPNEKLTVEFEGYGNQEVLGAEDLKKLITEDKVTEQPRPEVYQGVAAPKRPRAGQEVLQTRTEMPKRMQIREGDDEATIAKKRKMIRSFKKAQRSQTLDAITQEKQAAWKSFQKSKLSKGKPGFLTGKRVGKGGGAL